MAGIGGFGVTTLLCVNEVRRITARSRLPGFNERLFNYRPRGKNPTKSLTLQDLVVKLPRYVRASEARRTFFAPLTRYVYQEKPIPSPASLAVLIRDGSRFSALV